jgi:hypothetical protein
MIDSLCHTPKNLLSVQLPATQQAVQQYSGLTDRTIFNLLSISNKEHMRTTGHWTGGSNDKQNVRNHTLHG